MLRVGFDELDERILPDMGVKVSFLEKPSEDETPAAETPPRVTIPSRALREVDGQNVVLVVRDGKIEQRAVMLGNITSDRVEIEAGVDAGEQVVVAGPEELADGATVRIADDS